MDNEHKNKIDLHMSTCVREINFDLLFEELVWQNIFNKHMQNEILAIPPNERTEFMLNYIKTRGPNAYRTLLQCLYKTNHTQLALLFGYRLLQAGDNMNDASDLDNDAGVRKAVERKDLSNPAKIYHMGSKPRGLALVVNINKYVNNIQDERVGAGQDVARLKSVLQDLSYKIDILEDLTLSDFQQKLKTFARSEEHSLYDSCIVILMTHGYEGESANTVDCWMIDGKINSEQIIQEFYGYKAKNLSGKPKMFFFQTCRGDDMDHAMTPPPVRKTQIDGKVDRYDFPRSIEDILVVFPSAPGKVSIRDPEEGAWFIQELCNVICKSAWDTHIEAMIKQVDQNIKQRYDVENGKQTICFTNIGFNKDLYFNPGLYDS